MITIKFSEEEKVRLNRERYYSDHARVRQIMKALWLKACDLPHHEICTLADISSTTLTEYLKRYQKHGLESLLKTNFHSPTSELEAHEEKLKAHFEKKPPATVKEAVKVIEDITGIKRSNQRVRMFLKKLGLKFRKVGMIPAKADPEKQEAIKKDKLNPKLEEAKAHKRVVYFVDAAHFVLAPFLGWLWSFCRLFIKAPCGRQRFNVLGALNACDHQLITIENDSYINSNNMCELLEKIRAAHPDMPITLFLDNARYQKCALVFEKAKETNIELEYLPAYSPNLNLIERLWKFVKKTCLYSIYYEKFKEFKAAIKNCLSQTHSTYKEELDSLLTRNFQSFDKSKFMAV